MQFQQEVEEDLQNSILSIVTSSGAPTVNAVKAPRISTGDIYATGDLYLYGAVRTPLNLAAGITGLDFADGSAAAPSINFASSPTTGFYLASSGVIGVSSSGSSTLAFGSTGLTTVSGNLTIGSATGTINFSGSTIINVGSITFASLITASITSPSADLSISSATANINFNNKNFSSVNILNVATCKVFTSITSNSADLSITSATANIAFNSKNLINIGSVTPTSISCPTITGVTSLQNSGGGIVYPAGVTTLDVTPTTVYSITLAQDSAYNIRYVAVAAVAADGSTATYETSYRVTNFAGVVTVQATYNTFTNIDFGLSGSSISTSTAVDTLNLQVVGIAGTVVWKTRVEYINVTF